MKLRRLTAVWAAKMISAVCRHTGRQGVTLAGKVALWIDPTVLADMASQVKQKIFVVCGTNGKTTTNNLLCAAIESEGKKLVCNRTGSNMLQGVVAAFVLAARMNGTLDADYACLEVDEASAQHIFPHFQPDYMILTNLFRDQLDRYGEIDLTMDLLARAMKMAPDMTVIVNGDDALAAYLVMEGKNPYRTYGITEQVFTQQKEQEVRDGQFCKKCGGRLVYKFYHYGQIGKYHCPSCGFSRPVIDFDASGIDMQDGLQFEVEGRQFSVDYRGFYNIYNVLAAYSALRTARFPVERFQIALNAFRPQNGRMERFQIGDATVLLNLAKNPAGFNQNIQAVMEDPDEKDVIIVINDHAADGTDVSWLWDVDFDCLAGAQVCSVTASGIRCLDMQLRLKYVGIAAEAAADIRHAIKGRIDKGSKNLYVLVNYTALAPTREILLE